MAQPATTWRDASVGVEARADDAGARRERQEVEELDRMTREEGMRPVRGAFVGVLLGSALWIGILATIWLIA